MSESSPKNISLELRKFRVEGLFGYLDHQILFPRPSEDRADPTVVILHGRNGIGKTTILRMLDGMLRLDFNIFRTTPFFKAELQFTNNHSIRVSACNSNNELSGLPVNYKECEVILNPKEPGPLTQDSEEVEKTEQFRRIFFNDTKLIQFDFIDTERLHTSIIEEYGPELSIRHAVASQFQQRIEYSRKKNPKARVPMSYPNLSARVAEFIRDAQVNVRRFFASSEPELFQKVIEQITSVEYSEDTLSNLKNRLMLIHHQSEKVERYGLETEYWDFDQIMTLVNNLEGDRGATHRHAITVLNSYVEMLESRSDEQKLVADRLETFENELEKYFEGKRVSIHPSDGLVIKTDAGALLREDQLSSGEFHLLYLMVSALVTRRRGTVIAIDEPEMSMHIAWQRKLIPSLLKCASKAEPLFILATHSPDLAASFSQGMIDLG